MNPNRIWICLGIAALLTSTRTATAGTPDYRVDSAYGKDRLASAPRNIAIDEKDQIYMLLEDGSVAILDAQGKTAGGFKPAVTPPASAIAVAGGKVYLVVATVQEVVRETQGRKQTKAGPAAVKCYVFTPTGTKESEIELPGLLSATDAHFIGAQLAVADFKGSQIVTFELTSPKAKPARKLNDVFRLCCGIFNFYPSADGKSLIVANLGAFKVQTYTGGRKSHEFGARGDKDEEFHGCCNPVNVADIAGEFLVTVEKAPTRVKICGRKGQDPKSIEGLGELVDGCTTIPIAIDSKGSLYLASATRSCVVKCVTDATLSTSAKPVVSPAPASRMLAAPAAGPMELSETRDWHDVSGRTVTGKLIAFEPVAGAPTGKPMPVRDGNICLLVNGKSYDLPMTRLAREDQDFLAKLRAEPVR